MLLILSLSAVLSFRARHTDMELVLKHRMLNRVREQLKHFLTGFYEIIPEALLTIFDFQVCMRDDQQCSCIDAFLRISCMFSTHA